MPPNVALLLWFVCLLGLLYFDPAREKGISLALWVPVCWLFILGSRLPSQWLGVNVQSASAALQEGNPVDRVVWSTLILLAFVTLLSRRFPWGSLLVRNTALLALLGYALLSVCWSDFPLAALRKWVRDLGEYLVILVALSDPRPVEGVRTVLRRICYLLIPLCIVLNKYFPEVSRIFDAWTGVGMFAGATTGKNLLGLLALLSTIFFVSDTTTRWHQRREPRTKRILLINLAFLGMSLSLLESAHSATSWVCLLLGCLVIAACHGRFFRRHRALLQVLIPVAFCLYLVLAFGFGLSGEMASAVGKDPTLTDRTRIWSFVLGMHTNPLIGTGYESFWMGPRLAWIWNNAGLGGLTEAHNGYLEVYLNLGIVGLFFLAIFLLAGYRTIWKTWQTSPLFSFNLAIWAIMLFYSVTEAGFRSGLIWVVLLLGTLVVPARAAQRADVRQELETQRLRASGDGSWAASGLQAHAGRTR